MESEVGVEGSVLLGPGDLFAVLSRSFGPWDEDSGLFEAVVTSDVVPYVGSLDV